MSAAADEIEVVKLADVRVLGSKVEPALAVLRMTTAEGIAHHFDCTGSELIEIARCCVIAARTLGFGTAPTTTRQ